MTDMAWVARAPTGKVVAAVVLGGLSGVCYAALIPLLLDVLQTEPADLDGLARLTTTPWRLGPLEVAHPPMALLFTFCCLFIVLTRTLSQVVLNRAATDKASALREYLYVRIAGAPISAIEALGRARLVAALTSDVPRIVLGARLLPDVLMSAVTVLGLLSFLLIRNSDVFFYVVGCVLFGMVTYQAAMQIGYRYFIRSRQAYDKLQLAIDGLIHGVKELKLNGAKAQAYFDETLLAYEAEVRAAEKTGHTISNLAANYGDMLSFFVIGWVVFVFVNSHAMSSQELIGVVMVLLYVASPTAIILRALPQLAIAKVALKHFSRVVEEVSEEPAPEADTPVQAWSSIRLGGVEYRYESLEGEFKVGPIDLELHRGEITFIVGGNGSGKSTLGKILALHYAPQRGLIFFGAQAITPQRLRAHRECISALHVDYHLFDRLMGVKHPSLEARVQSLLTRLGLAHKVRFLDGRFSTVALSDGQRRRLALLTAVVEDRDFYLFDEWAADQAPDFKEIFYTQILPELKKANKLVVAITHDDRYFALADQLVVMESGQVVDLQRRVPQAPATRTAER